MYGSVLDLVGGTPLVRLSRLKEAGALGADSHWARTSR